MIAAAILAALSTAEPAAPEPFKCGTRQEIVAVMHGYGERIVFIGLDVEGGVLVLFAGDRTFALVREAPGSGEGCILTHGDVIPPEASE